MAFTKWFVDIKELKTGGVCAEVCNVHGDQFAVFYCGFVLNLSTKREADPRYYSNGFISRVRSMGRKAIAKECSL
jgi:hypothetical protein